MKGNSYILHATQRECLVLMLFAWRYCRDRHTTQALFPEVHHVIVDNINLIDTWVLEQMVRDIELELRIDENVSEEDKKSAFYGTPDYLIPFKEYLQKVIEERDK